MCRAAPIFREIISPHVQRCVVAIQRRCAATAANREVALGGATDHDTSGSRREVLTDGHVVRRVPTGTDGRAQSERRALAKAGPIHDEAAAGGDAARTAERRRRGRLRCAHATRSHDRWAGDRRCSQRRSTAHSPTTSPYVSVTICCVATRLTNSGAAVTLSLSGSWVDSRLDAIVRHGRSDLSHA